jgi:hypothetical protein
MGRVAFGWERTRVFHFVFKSVKIKSGWKTGYRKGQKRESKMICGLFFRCLFITSTPNKNNVVKDRFIVKDFFAVMRQNFIFFYYRSGKIKRGFLLCFSLPCSVQLVCFSSVFFM